MVLAVIRSWKSIDSLVILMGKSLWWFFNYGFQNGRYSMPVMVPSIPDTPELWAFIAAIYRNNVSAAVFVMRSNGSGRKGNGCINDLQKGKDRCLWSAFMMFCWVGGLYGCCLQEPCIFSWDEIRQYCRMILFETFVVVNWGRFRTIMGLLGRGTSPYFSDVWSLRVDAD